MYSINGQNKSEHIARTSLQLSKNSIFFAKKALLILTQFHIVHKLGGWTVDKV